MISYSIFFFFLVQSSFGNFDDSYPENSDNYNLYADEFLDPPDDGDVEKRDNHFMRFGRAGGDYKNKEYIYDDVEEPSAHVKRSGNHHVRFGRSGSNSFMRYGRDPPKVRSKSMFMRMGRNVPEQDDKIRSKRSTSQQNLARRNEPNQDYPKRKLSSNYILRYGRDSDRARGFADPSSLIVKNAAFLDQLSPANGNDIKENHLLTLILAKLLARREDFLAKSFEDSV